MSWWTAPLVGFELPAEELDAFGLLLIEPARHGSDDWFAPVRDLCVSCHDTIGTQLTEQVPHAPADDCLTCHESHVARHASLLLESQAEGCLACHDGDSEEFGSAHLGLPASSMDCGSCHDPHASQMAGMLLPEVHAPFAAGECSVCHETTQKVQP